MPYRVTSIRLPPALIALLDAEARRRGFESANGAGRSELIRQIVTRALDGAAS